MQPERFHPADTTPPQASRWWRQLHGRRLWFYAGLSLLIVLPCHWQPRIQAGDLSSHLYNAWLAQLIESGRAEGLVIVRQTTNILFDLVLDGLFRLFGAEAAQRITVSAAVLVFVWGAFTFASEASRRRPWHLMPCVGMLAYGWVYHMGFFNFYLSMGLCFWVLAAAWRPTRIRVAAAAALMVLAYTAHALPVVWTMCLLAYLWMARRVMPRRRVALTASFLISMLGVHVFVASTFVSRWSPQQISLSIGADQTWVFGVKYYLVLAGLLLVWGLLFLDLLHLRGMRRTVLGIPFQLCILSAATVVALPDTILIPGFHHNLVYIAERMSLGVGICMCALLAAARPRYWERIGMVGLAGIFFVFLYADERALNRFEDGMQGVVAQLPPGKRIVNSVADATSRTNSVTHVLDRVCVGRCFSFANYEPSTAQFRIRTVRRNPFVVDSYADSWALQSGTYVPRESDLPLYQIDLDNRGGLVIKPLKAGTLCGKKSIEILPRWAARYSGRSWPSAFGWILLPGLT
jgi:hypothetical protein